MLEALFGTQPDSARRRRGDDDDRDSSWGVWDVGHILGGAGDTGDVQQSVQQTPRTTPSSPIDIETRRARAVQSPNGSESPVTVLAEDAAISPNEGSGNWLPFLSSRGRPSHGSQASQSRASRASLPPEGPEMAAHRILDQLQNALVTWEAAMKSRTSFTGDWRPGREEQAVEFASASLEDLRASLAQEGVMKRMLGSRDSEQGAVRGHEVLQALAGHSPWSDQDRVQELLRRRADFLTNQTFDPYRSRFSVAKQFLQLVGDKRRWPQAEALALQWPEVLERTLGGNGADDWKKRAQSLLDRAAAARERSRAQQSSGPWCEALEDFDFLDLGIVEAKSHDRGAPSVKGEVSGRFTFTRIRAFNLRSADMLDESDPFVRFELGSLAQGQTSVVWNNEKNPEWKDPNTGRWEEVILDVREASTERFPQLHISVWDKDTFTHNDSLGSQVLSLVDLMQKHGGYSSASRTFANPVSGSTGSLVLQGPGAGDRGPTIEFEFTWAPNLHGPNRLDGLLDPLALPPAEDDALQLVAEMELELPKFLREFGPKSAESLGFFLQPQDCHSDIRKRPDVDKRHSNSEIQRVKDYNELLNKIKNRLQHHHVDFREINSLIQELREVETRAGSGSGRRIFAFQDEDLPTIGEWSTDRRRQLRNQLFLAKLNSGIVPVERGWNPYLLPTFVLLAVFFCLLSLLVLTFFRDENGRGWIVILFSLSGFMSVAVAITVSLPKWKPYFDKPRTGANSYQSVAASA